MADFKNDFVPAFPYPIKWSVGDNTFDDSDKNPKTIGLAIPVDSIAGLVNLFRIDVSKAAITVL